MKKIVVYNEGIIDYNVGDIVYLDHKNGKPTCRAIAIMEDDGRWLFNPFRKQSYYSTVWGLIPFGGKPFIFAKEVEEKEAQP